MANHIAKAIAFALIFGVPIVASAQSCPPTNVPTVYERQVKITDIGNAILMGDWNYALKLATDYARQYLQDCQNNEKILSAINRIAGKAKAIVNDPTKTEAQKRTEIFRLLDESILPYESPPAGELNATYRYSLEFGISRVSFDVETRDDMCEFSVNVNFGCATDLYTGRQFCYNPQAGITYVQSRHVRTPNIYVFRQVDGFPEEQVTKFDGQTIGGRTGVFYAEAMRYPDVKWTSAKQYAWNAAVARFNGTPATPVSRVSIDLPTSSFVQIGRRVGYRIAAEWPAWSYRDGRACAQTFVKQSQFFVDADANARIDIIPAAEYSKFFGKLVAPVLPAILSSM